MQIRETAAKVSTFLRRLTRSSQRNSVTGSGNVVVQVVGDGNTIVAGAAYLTLTRYLGRRRSAGAAYSVAEPLDLLQPYGLAVPWVGRERLMAELWRWLEGEAPISIRVLTAPGGGGKTRAALELCDQATRKGWDAGFATAGELERFRGARNASQWGWRRPTLLVVDYAASRTELLAGWLGELADHAGWPGRPLRLLLLERHASPSEGWWRTAFGQGSGDALAVGRLLDPRTGPYQLPRLDQAERRALIRAVWQLLGSALELPEESAEFDRQLAAVSWGGEPLFLIIAAVAAVRSGLAAALSLSAPDLARSVAEGELGRLRRLARTARIDEDFFVHLAAYATLCQGLSRAEAEAAVTAEKAAMGYASGGDPPKLYKALRGALPESGDGIAPVVPDVVGELLALLALGDGSEPAAAAAAQRAGAQAPVRVVATVLRMALDYGRLAPQAMAWLDGLATASENDTAALAAIVDQIPVHTVSLREFAARWTARVVELLYGMQVGKQPDPAPQLARQLLNLGTRLTDLGRRGAALRPTEESVALYRQLAARDSGSFESRLAAALTNLAASHWALRQAEPALAAAEEAVRRFDALSAPQREAVQSEYAFALRNLAAFRRLPRQTRPLFEQAVELLRRVAASGAPEARADLASALGDLATALGGDNEAAITALGEAISILRELATAQPFAYGAMLARALAYLGHGYTVAGRREAAGDALGEALQMYGEVVGEEEDELFFEIGQTLHRMSVDLAILGRRDAAVAAAQEASRRYGVLAATERDTAFASDLGHALVDLAGLLVQSGRPEAGLEAARKAVALLRYLEANGVAKTSKDLPRALVQEAFCLRDMRREKEALVPLGEAVTILRQEAAEQPGRQRIELAETLSAQAPLLAAIGERDAALAAAEESVQLQREAAGSEPDMMLAFALNNFSNVLSSLGLAERELGAMEEALEMMLAALREQPPATVGMLPFLVDNYRRRAEDAGREPRAELLAAARAALGA
jgi:tetratricopeptide (TPR) repeat protein